jgi:GDP-mannose 4,6 dehydratase
MRKCALITGITGQAGSYPADLLLAKGYEVRGLKCRSSSFKTDRIDHLYFDPHTGDPPLLLRYRDITSIIRKIQEVRPEEIYDLVAQRRYRGNRRGLKRVACPRSGTRPGTDEQPGGGPPAKCLRARGDDPPRLRRYLRRQGL